MRMKPLHRALCAIFLPLLFVGCFAHIQTLPKADRDSPSFPPLPSHTDTVIGIALSGGGSRAAYFGAAGLEALAHVRIAPGQPSVLEQASYLSSVSGGSVASSYFATHKPKADVAALDAHGSLTPAYQRFFAQYRNTMAENYQWSIVWRQFVKVRWLNSNQRATSLAEVLDATFLNGQTFEEIYQREKAGDSPRLILNATLYNNGRRFVMTTIPRDDFRYDFIPKLQSELLAKSVAPKPLPESLQKAKEALNPLTFQDHGADPRGIPLSRAVAASASFPFFIGPITAQVEGQDTYVHAGDGGLFDNQGTESLVQLFLKQLEDKKVKRALVVAFDSSFPFWAKNNTLDRMENGFDIFVKDSGRIVGIMEQRANAYQAMIWHILQSQRIVLPDDTTIKIIVLRHAADVWPDDVASALPAACQGEKNKLQTKQDILDRLALIPTLFKLESECDKALLAEAAVRLVQKKKDEIVGFLRGN
ncbi:MAG: patatin-like phospholipase family protein [Nitrospirales bacterium]